MRPETSWDVARAEAVIAEHIARPGAALPLLHGLQAAFGCIPEPAIPLVAEALNITRAELRGIVSFYHDFRSTPPGRRVLHLCRAEACQAMGAARLARELLARLGIGWGETTEDGGLTVLPVYCLGLCACAPAALLDGTPIGELDDARLSECLA